MQKFLMLRKKFENEGNYHAVSILRQLILFLYDTSDESFEDHYFVLRGDYEVANVKKVLSDAGFYDITIITKYDGGMHIRINSVD